RVEEAVRGDLPLAGHVADDVRVTVRIDLQERAVERGHRLERGKRLLLVRVEARRVSADGRQQDSATARCLRRLRDSEDGQTTDHGRERAEESDDAVTPDPCRHLAPPETLDVRRD